MIPMKNRHRSHPGPATGRGAAIETMYRWQDSGRPVDAFLEPVARDLPARERHLAKQIVYGILRNLQTLDLVIGNTASHPLRRMKPRTLAALRVGAYQLLFLDRVPPSAAVNETVRALKKMRQPRWLLSFVNGVLRAIARAGDSLPGRDSAGGRSLSNHPRWLVDRWQARFGRAAAEAICRANNEPPPLTLRVNSRRIDRPGLLARLEEAGCPAAPGHVAPDSIVLQGRTGPVTELPGYGEGLFLVQDEAAQLACLLAGSPGRGIRCLDACAGLGGKTASLLLAAENDVMLAAVEPDKRRFRLLEENMARLGLSGQVLPFAGTLAQFAATAAGPFDLIFIDAPCSGTGVIRRHPDIRWNRRPEDLESYCRQQLDLLAIAGRLLAASGVLVYATCSLEPEENELVIRDFLAANPDFAVDPCAGLLPAAAARLVDERGFFRPLPHDGMDGFFAARLIRDPGL